MEERIPKKRGRKDSRVDKKFLIVLDINKSSYEYKLFDGGIKTDKTRKVYRSILDFFMFNNKFTKYNQINELSHEDRMKALKLHILNINQMSRSSVNQQLSALGLYCDMNELTYSRKVLSKLMPARNKRTAGGRKYTNEELQKMLNFARSPRSRALLLFFASFGARPQILEDPVLKIEHLTKLEIGIYQIHLYSDDEMYEYYAHLTPEATKALDDYFSFRKLNGEVLTKESPVFVNNRELKNTKNDFMSANNGRFIIREMIRRAGIVRTKVNGDKSDLSEFYGFRKRYSTIIKDCKEINVNLAEKMLSHTFKLDGAYYRPEPETYLEAFLHVQMELTVSDDARDKLKILKLEKDNKKLKLQKRGVTRHEFLNLQNQLDEMIKKSKN